MGLAKKATLDDVNLKIMVWGESGSGKSRFALSSPNPIVIDLEGSTRLYAEQFDFYKAEVDKTDNRASSTDNRFNTTISSIYFLFCSKYMYCPHTIIFIICYY